MPKLMILSVDEAMVKSATGRRAQILEEYLGYIDRLREGQAGKLQPSKGESVAAVRRRLGSAAKASGKNLVIRRVGEEIYVWVGARPIQRQTRRPAKQFERTWNSVRHLSNETEQVPSSAEEVLKAIQETPQKLNDTEEESERFHQMSLWRMIRNLVKREDR